MPEAIFERNFPISGIVIYDASDLLWILEWPRDKVQLNVYVKAN